MCYCCLRNSGLNTELLTSTALQEKAQALSRKASAEVASLKAANAQLQAQLQQASPSRLLQQQQEDAAAAQQRIRADLQEQQASCASLTSQNRYQQTQYMYGMHSATAPCSDTCAI